MAVRLNAILKLQWLPFATCHLLIIKEFALDMLLNLYEKLKLVLRNYVFILTHQVLLTLGREASQINLPPSVN